MTMTERYGPYTEVGRKTPAGGAHIFLGHTNVFFVTVNAKDRIPWIGQPTVQSALVNLWRDEANAWLVVLRVRGEAGLCAGESAAEGTR